jgi:prepilin peptidase CpaA
VETVVVLVALAIFVVVGERDVRTRQIPNELALAIAILGLLRMMLIDSGTEAALTLAATTAVFLTGFFLFWRDVFGGGDIKLIAATALVIGYRDVFRFFIVTSLCGAALALITLVVRKQRPRHWWISRPLSLPSEMVVQPPGAPPCKLSVPYGVAIAAGGVMTLIAQISVPK